VIEHVPAAETVFEIVRIDSCCRRDRTLAEASVAAGIDVDEVISLLREMSLDSTTHPTALRADAALPDVTAQIRDQYHRRARAFLVMLTRSVRALAGSHGHTFPELATVQSSIEQLARDLVPHMSREEKYLFPYIDSLAGGHADREIVVPLFGRVEYPLEFVKHDHADDMQLIATLRDTTGAFTTFSFRARLRPSAASFRERARSASRAPVRTVTPARGDAADCHRELRRSRGDRCIQKRAGSPPLR